MGACQRRRGGAGPPTLRRWRCQSRHRAEGRQTLLVAAAPRTGLPRVSGRRMLGHATTRPARKVSEATEATWTNAVTPPSETVQPRSPASPQTGQCCPADGPAELRSRCWPCRLRARWACRMPACSTIARGRGAATAGDAHPARSWPGSTSPRHRRAGRLSQALIRSTANGSGYFAAAARRPAPRRLSQALASSQVRPLK